MGSSDGQFPQGASALPPPSLPPPSTPTSYGAPLTPGTPVGPVTPRGAKGKGLVIGAALAGVVAIAVAAVVVFGGGDEGPTVAPTTIPAITTTSGVPITEPVATLPVLTTPEVVDTTIPSPWGDVAIGTIVDETGLFSVTVPAAWESSNGQRELFGAAGVGVSAAPALDAYVNGDEAAGITVAMVYSSDVDGPVGLATSYLDAIDICTAEDWQSNVETSYGSAELLLFDGCATGSMYAKTVFIVESGMVTVMVAGQGLGPADGDLLTVVQAVLDSVTFL